MGLKVGTSCEVLLFLQKWYDLIIDFFTVSEETQCPGSQGNTNTGNTNNFGM